MFKEPEFKIGDYAYFISEDYESVKMDECDKCGHFQYGTSKVIRTVKGPDKVVSVIMDWMEDDDAPEYVYGVGGRSDPIEEYRMFRTEEGARAQAIIDTALEENQDEEKHEERM